ncbi:MAG: response regulator transcription factor [Intrasporangiaceae bacterium]|nr:response regulator transcription factor [Intrasporangiaceae bacterium]
MADVIRLLIADDQALIRDAFATLLGLESDFEVVAQVAGGDAVLAAAREHRPDVCLLDIEMPGLDGIEACRALTDAGLGARVLIVTTFGRPGYLRRALEAGASGFIVKDTPAAQLIDAVRRVHRGLRVIDPDLASESLLDGANPLTSREQELLRLSLRGTAVAAMAAELHLSPRTVRNQLSAAIQKTGAGGRVEAARVAQDRGWL